MWVLAVYDCPMTDSEARHDYAAFRHQLLEANFSQLQNSLYVRHFPTLAAAEASIARLKPAIPKGASVAFFMLTDKQFAMTHEYFGTKATRKRPEIPEQVELF